MNLMPFADQLVAQGVGVEGENIFVNMMPIECSLGILLRNRLSGTLIDYNLPGYYKAQFQLIARAKNYASGQMLINQAIAALTISELQVESLFVNYCRPKNQPVAFPLSNGNNLEFSVYMDVCFVETPGAD